MEIGLPTLTAILTSSSTLLLSQLLCARLPWDSTLIFISSLQVLFEELRDTMRSDTTARGPTILPPPYTSTGMKNGSLRTNPEDFCTTAEVLVGPEPPTSFILHTSLLTSQSPYFRAALNGPFLESTTKSIRLQDESVNIFELCVSWLYTGSIHPLPFKDGKPAYYTLLHLYILADRLCFEGLRNRIVDVISDLADSTNSVLTPSDTRILYEQIGDHTTIRKLILDLFAFKKTDKLLDEHADRWHAGFLRDLCVRLKRPCEQSMLRHRLRMWCPEQWHATRCCEGCRAILPPRYGAVACEECCCAWCVRCVDEGVGMASWEDGRGRWDMGEKGVARLGTSLVMGGDAERERSDELWEATGKRLARIKRRKWESCKPWRGSRCRVYHEHKETEACGEVFLGH
ncbi:hypothetical protein B0J11DRAFT_421763 [Dendryphion nanum]|uniref:BTB domain-containing protein n=1 Tax=Dendryphion nanum TaxID=256645 RepID=A0A9P9EIS6_9PLEO|nr:hypothetical protein B0J11DRAFT_421763 [Dendryphion nanum]